MLTFNQIKLKQKLHCVSTSMNMKEGKNYKNFSKNLYFYSKIKTISIKSEVFEFV